jgi:hypothetical protein
MAHWTKTILLITLLGFTAGCVKKVEPATDGNSTSKPKEKQPLLITKGSEMRGQMGKVVRLRGQLDRAKLGDIIEGPGFSVYCIDKRFADALLGNQVTVQGTLGVRDTGAKVYPDGSISQGTPPGTSSTVLKNCKLVQ